ncbi:TetR/AcrR family transcriptional regulator [Streptomyces sp. NPDC054933]
MNPPAQGPGPQPVQAAAPPDPDQAGHTPADDAGEPRRVTRRRAHTRQRLLDAALEVFAERGLGAATVEEVCERAGYTRGAFYSNFRTMEELFSALHQQRSDMFLERALQVLLTDHGACAAPGGRPTRDGVDAAVDLFLSVLPHDRAWWLVSMEYHLHAARDPQAARQLAERRRRFREQLAPVLETAVARIGRRLTVGADELIRVLIAVHEGAVAQSSLEPDAVPYQHLDRLALAPLVRSLTAAVLPESGTA